MDRIAQAAEVVLASPATGDNSQILIIGAAVCVAVIVIVILMGKRRK